MRRRNRVSPVSRHRVAHRGRSLEGRRHDQRGAPRRHRSLDGPRSALRGSLAPRLSSGMRAPPRPTCPTTSQSASSSLTTTRGLPDTWVGAGPRDQAGATPAPRSSQGGRPRRPRCRGGRCRTPTTGVGAARLSSSRSPGEPGVGGTPARKLARADPRGGPRQSDSARCRLPPARQRGGTVPACAMAFGRGGMPGGSARCRVGEWWRRRHRPSPTGRIAVPGPRRGGKGHTAPAGTA